MESFLGFASSCDVIIANQANQAMTCFLGVRSWLDAEYCQIYSNIPSQSHQCKYSSSNWWETRSPAIRHAPWNMPGFLNISKLCEFAAPRHAAKQGLAIIFLLRWIFTRKSTQGISPNQLEVSDILLRVSKRTDMRQRKMKNNDFVDLSTICFFASNLDAVFSSHSCGFQYSWICNFGNLG